MMISSKEATERETDRMKERLKERKESKDEEAAGKDRRGWCLEGQEKERIRKRKECESSHQVEENFLQASVIK